MTSQNRTSRMLYLMRACRISKAQAALMLSCAASTITAYRNGKKRVIPELSLEMLEIKADKLAKLINIEIEAAK